MMKWIRLQSFPLLLLVSAVPVGVLLGTAVYKSVPLPQGTKTLGAGGGGGGGGSSSITPDKFDVTTKVFWFEEFGNDLSATGWWSTLGTVLEYAGSATETFAKVGTARLTGTAVAADSEQLWAWEMASDHTLGKNLIWITRLRAKDGTDQEMRAGFGQDDIARTNSDLHDSVWFEVTNDGNWQAKTSNGTSTTTTDTGVPWADNTWFTLKIVGTATGYEFYIDGVLKATNTTNLPDQTGSDAVLAAFRTEAIGGTTANTMYIDYVYATFDR